MTENALPQRARVVVVGGGVIGTSVAYHLAHLGEDVVLLERDRLTCGTTWHAAGLMVTFGSTSETSTEMRKYTRDLYARLEAETGPGDGLQAGRLHRGRHRPRPARGVPPGLGVQPLLRRRRARDLAGARSASCSRWRRSTTSSPASTSPDDGRANPVDVTMALAKGAQLRGATMHRGRAASPTSLTERGAVTGVRTPYGDIEAEYVVNCAGMWARQLAARSGVDIPLQAAEHYYLITEPIEGMSGDWPVLEDPASHGYFREEGGGLMVGLFEPVCAPWKVDGVPEDFSFGELAARLGPDGAVPRDGDEPRADHGGGRREEVLLRAGELHARPAADRRRGAGAARTTSSPPGSTRSASSPAAASAA